MKFIASRAFEIWVPSCVNDLMESTVEECPKTERLKKLCRTEQSQKGMNLLKYSF